MNPPAPPDNHNDKESLGTGYSRVNTTTCNISRGWKNIIIRPKKIDYLFSVRARVEKNDPHLGFFFFWKNLRILFLLRYFHEEPSEREVFFAVFKYCPCKNSLIKAWHIVYCILIKYQNFLNNFIKQIKFPDMEEKSLSTKNEQKSLIQFRRFYSVL